MRQHSEIAAPCECGRSLVIDAVQVPCEAVCQCGRVLVADWHAEPVQRRDDPYDVMAKIQEAA